MQRDQCDQHIRRQFVPAGEHVTELLADQRLQRAVEGDVVIGKQAAADLKGQQHQQSEDREGAQRVVAVTVPLPLEIGQDLARCRKKLAEAGVGRTQQPPDQTESDQADDGQTQLAMPLHEVAADLATDHGTNDAQDQRPVEDAGR